jgi:ABC-type uncharacterized transport system permease subunit
MGGPQVIVGQNRPSHEPSRVDPLLGWSAVGTLAILFVLAGLVDISIAFYPPRFSEKAWLFGVLGGVIAGLPVLSLGLAGGLIAAISLKAPTRTKVLGVLNALLALLILVGLVLYLGALTEVRRNAPVELLPTISKNTVRTTLAGALFFALHATAFWVSRRPNMFGGPNN